MNSESRLFRDELSDSASLLAGIRRGYIGIMENQMETTI